MLWKDIANLITITQTRNSILDVIEAETLRQVYVNKKSIRQNEFYQAHATGLQPEVMFEIRSEDYHGEDRIRHNNKTYNIIRTYDKNGEITELICQGLVNK